MRNLTTILTMLLSGLLLGQGGPCDQVQAGFTPFPNGSTVQFSNATTGTASGTLFFWSFGDGATSQDPQPWHTYNGPGVYEVCLTVVTILTGPGGVPLTCEDTFCTALTVQGPQPCSPNFLVAMDWVDQGNGLVTFVATSTFPNTNFVWYFGDGSEAYGPTANHAYVENGIYSVCVAGWYYNGSAQDTCWIEDCDVITVDGGPCEGLSACFVPNDLGNGTFFFDNCSSEQGSAEFVWSFGDGTTSTAINAEHDYIQDGTYEVCLKGSYNGCIFDTCQTVVVIGTGENPCEALNANFTPFVAGLGVNIQNAVVNSTWTYLWNFGDGTTGVGPSAGHQYAAPGTYTICLTVYTWDPVAQDTCYADHCETVIVGAQGCDPNFAVELAWNAGPNNMVYFNATSNQPNTNFIWYFGDGTEGAGPQVVHTYPESGTYYPCVTGWYYNEATQDTCWIEDCEVIIVGGGILCDQLTACFQPSQLSSSGFFFNNCSSPQTSAQFVWDFGDGSTSSAVAPIHTYTASGSYTVCLTVYWENCVDSTCMTITVVGENPCEALNANFTPFVGGLGVNIQNAVVNNTWTYLWNFGDGTTGVGPSAGHQYAAPGTYTICLTVYTWDPVAQDTCYADHCETVIVGAQGCDPNFAVELAWNAGPNNMVYFNATSNQPNTNFIWYFGDGIEGAGPQVVHTYPESGTYYPCVTGWYYNEATQDTCWVEDCTAIIVGGGTPCDSVVACFEPVPLPGNIIFFENCSTAPEDATYFWDFGDGQTYTAPLIEHVYAQPGVYTVCLTVTWANCVDSTCSTVTVVGDDPCDGLVACFEPQPFENGAYFFANCSQILPIAIPVYYFWDFGDGITSDDQQPDHVFIPGTYNVCLTVTQGDCVDITCTTIFINGGGEGCDPSYTASFTYTVQNNAVIFQANIDTPTLGVVWTFPDGEQAYEHVHTHLFEPPGPFEVCLSTWYWNEQTQDTCWAHTCQLIDPFNVITTVTEDMSDHLSVYPVPAHDQLTIEGSTAGAYLQVVSADGRLAITAHSANSTHRLDVRALAKGTYVLAVEQGGTRTHHRFVVD